MITAVGTLALFAALCMTGCCQIAPWFLRLQTESAAVTREDVGLHVYPRQPPRPVDQVVDSMRDRILRKGALSLYVHGRGDHPDAAYERSLIADCRSALPGVKIT